MLVVTCFSNAGTAARQGMTGELACLDSVPKL